MGTNYNDGNMDAKPSPAEVLDISEIDPEILLSGTHQNEQEPLMPPPSSIHGEFDDEEEEDNWSRQVEADVVPPAPHSINDFMGHPPDEAIEDSKATAVSVPEPEKPELSLKEKLVLRERQRRIETERARLKRQFAHTAEETSNDLDDDDKADETFISGAQSVGEGTLGGESTKAHPDEDYTHDESNRLGFNMERFLRNSDSFNPCLEPMHEQEAQETGVVMKRFLNNPVVIPHTVTATADPPPPPLQSDNALNGIAIEAESLAEPHRNVSFEVNGSFHAVADYDNIINLVGSSRNDISEFNTSREARQTSVTSMDDQAASSVISSEVEGDAASSNKDALSASDEPRVLRLTEADMLEMAAIEDASIGNAPPSERDEDDMLSEIGELADFGGSNPAAGNYMALSHDTPTTAMDSVSQISGNQSLKSVQHVASAMSSSSADIRETALEHIRVIEGLPQTASDPVHTTLSHESGSIVAHPPSESGRDEDIDYPNYETINMAPIVNVSEATTAAEVSDSPLAFLEKNTLQTQNEVSLNQMNRQRRYNPPENLDSPKNESGFSPSDTLPTVVVDGFDFDKDAPKSPLRRENSFQDLPVDPWSPPGAMNISPLQVGKNTIGLNRSIPEIPSSINYGTLSDDDMVDTNGSVGMSHAIGVDVLQREEEHTPLLDVPPEIISQRDISNPISVSKNRHRQSLVESMVEDVFYSTRSMEEEGKTISLNDSDHYLASSIWSKAFPERQFALLVTLIFEIPVLLMITGGSDALCQLIGRKRYHLLIGFLPLTSAISGNVGLQASTLTTRAISHAHVRPEAYLHWFLDEVGAATLLGLGMGSVLGTIAFTASGLDLAFGATIFVAQFISIVTAGITGTFAPLLFTFIFHRDSGKWGGPLETAIQDIVGSFAMIIISYHVLLLFGPLEIQPSDVCIAITGE